MCVKHYECISNNDIPTKQDYMMHYPITLEQCNLVMC